jgi:predicted permease
MFTAIDQDLRYAIRGLLRSPLFSIIAILSIAIGIGTNAAIFSLLDQVLIRPLPVEDPRALVLLDLPGARAGRTTTDYAISNPMFQGLKQRNQVFSGMFAMTTDSANLTYKGASETIPVAIVSGNLFDVLGLRASHGRLLSANDDVRRNGHPVAVLSHGYFQRRFGGDASIVGQTIRVNTTPFQVAGIAPKGFSGMEFDTVPNLYVPLAMKNAVTANFDGMDDPNYYFLHVYGRLRQGVEAASAKANLDTLIGPMVEDEMKNFPSMPDAVRSKMRARRVQLMPAGTPLLGPDDGETLRTALFLLMGIVGLLLLIACANVANLLLARANARAKEIAVRQALGAGQTRLIRQMLVESVLLSLLGGGLGLLLSAWILDALISFAPLDGATEVFLNATPDWRVAAFCLFASVTTGVLFGLAPAWQGSRGWIAGTLKDNAGGLAGHAAQGWMRRTLVVAQISISLVLLVTAGLFAKSLMNLKNTNPGFNPGYLLTFNIDPSLSGYERDQAINFLDRFRSDLQSLPGVRDVTVASNALLSNEVHTRTMSVEGVPRQANVSTNARHNNVGPSFFRVLGYPLIAGREFSDADRGGNANVAIVNEVFANDFFKGAALGKRIGFGYNKDGSQRLTMEIVGIVRDGKNGNLREKKVPRLVYTPYMQDDSIEGMSFYVRSSRDPERLTADVRAALRGVDSSLALYRVQTMDRTISESLATERLLASLCSSFGLIATFLAALGLYGVMAFNVARRTREIGIRLALGADRRGVIAMVMNEAGTMIALGAALGLPLALALGKMIESQLWNLKPWDPAVLGAALAGLAAVGLLAGLFPALRASRVPPMTALRLD